MSFAHCADGEHRAPGIAVLLRRRPGVTAQPSERTVAVSDAKVDWGYRFRKEQRSRKRMLIRWNRLSIHIRQTPECVIRHRLSGPRCASKNSVSLGIDLDNSAVWTFGANQACIRAIQDRMELVLKPAMRFFYLFAIF